MKTARHSVRIRILLSALALSIGLMSFATEAAMSKLELADKIRGAWIGKIVGCTYGGPVEFHYKGQMIPDDKVIEWSDKRVEHYFERFPGLYDDVYINIVFLEVLDRLGPDAPVDSFAMAFADRDFPLWSANQVAKYNIKHGIMPPMTGHWLNNPHADCIDYQIEADFAGVICPAMPEAAAELSDRVGHIFSYGDGWYGGVYVATLYTLAYQYDDMAQVVREALKAIPEQSDFYKCISDVVKCYESDSKDWKAAWRMLDERWSEEAGCPDGVFMPYDIEAKLNSAYVTIGLLYGAKDFGRTIDIATRCGQDADCNPSTAAGVLGVMLGSAAIPEEWRSAVYPVEDMPFAYTDVSLNRLCDISYRQALEEIRRNGGRVCEDSIFINEETPRAVRYEKSFEGHYPVERIKKYTKLEGETDFDFTGTGIVVGGTVKSATPEYSAEVGIILDGKHIETVDLPCSQPNAIDNRRYDLYNRYQLEPGEHRLTLRWLNPREGSEINVNSAVVFDNKPRKTER